MTSQTYLPESDFDERMLSLTPLDGDVEQVTLDLGPIGYIERVGRVFVALSGARRDHAVECCQSLDHEAALFALLTDVDSDR